MHRRHPNEKHLTGRMGWLRAAVLGANDGIVSTASLVLGVAAAHASTQAILLAGSAGLMAGAMSMAAGEYVSVHSQADSEQAELKKERLELETDVDGEHKELAAIYVGRGVDKALAAQVATQLMKHDALDAHARDELGISEIMRARPLQAAGASALSFAVGAALPLLVVLLSPPCCHGRSSLRRWSFWPFSAVWLLAQAAPESVPVSSASRSGARWRWQSPPVSACCSAWRADHQAASLISRQ